MNEILFWLLMPYVLTLGFVVGFMAYVPAPVVVGYGWHARTQRGWG